MPRSTILVIDDEPNILKTVKTSLELEDYSVEVAGNGALGLQKLAECEIDLVMLDVMSTSVLRVPSGTFSQPSGQ